MFLLQRNQVIVMDKMCGKHHYKGETLREGIGQWLLLTLFTQNVTFPQVLSLCRNQPIDLQSKIAEQICGPSFFINRTMSWYGLLLFLKHAFKVNFSSYYIRGGRYNQNHYVQWMGGDWVAQLLLCITQGRIGRKNAGF